ncbi:hypothetical protein V2G26_009586 [Clonostachys chloroleuca]
MPYQPARSVNIAQHPSQQQAPHTPMSERNAVVPYSNSNGSLKTFFSVSGSAQSTSTMVMSPDPTPQHSTPSYLLSAPAATPLNHTEPRNYAPTTCGQPARQEPPPSSI